MRTRRFRLLYRSIGRDTFELRREQWPVYLRCLRRRGYQDSHQVKRATFWARVWRDESGIETPRRLMIGCEERIRRLTKFGA